MWSSMSYLTLVSVLPPLIRDLKLTFFFLFEPRSTSNSAFVLIAVKCHKAPWPQTDARTEIQTADKALESHLCGSSRYNRCLQDHILAHTHTHTHTMKTFPANVVTAGKYIFHDANNTLLYSKVGILCFNSCCLFIAGWDMVTSPLPRLSWH